MKKTVAFILFTFIWVLNSFSQEFGTHWISHAFGNDSSEVFFCHTYITRHKPQKAFITVASTGRLRVYVNERNISRDVFLKNEKENTVTLRTYDITNVLSPDSNTIAVWYSPCEESASNKQLSLEYYGTDAQGTPFYHVAAEDWSSMNVEGCHIKDKEEFFDNRFIDSSWKAAGRKPTWSHPLFTHPFMQNEDSIQDKGKKDLLTQLSSFPATDNLLKRVYSPVAETEDSAGVHYDFGLTFKGTVRITLRNAKKGEKIRIDGLQYTCSGEMDEQAFRHFSTTEQRIVTVTGDKTFRKSQIQKIEGLRIGE